MHTGINTGLVVTGEVGQDEGHFWSIRQYHQCHISVERLAKAGEIFSGSGYQPSDGGAT